MLIGVTAILFLPLGVTAFQRPIGTAMTGQEAVSHALLGSLRWVRRRPILSFLGLVVPGTLIGLGMLRLEPETIARLKAVAHGKGMGYQTLIRMWVLEQLAAAEQQAGQVPNGAAGEPVAPSALRSPTVPADEQAG